MNESLKLVIILLLILLYKPIYSQHNAELILEHNKLKGTCENDYFTGFEIELDSNYAEIDSAILFKQFPRVGKLGFKNKFEIPTEFTITERAGFSQIMFRFRNDYLTFDNLNVESNSISFLVNNDPQVPVTKQDLAIIKTAKGLLSDEKYWNNIDDRNCTDDLANKSYSLYCALRISSLQIEEKYNHRNAALQKLRHLIEQKHPDRKWTHRLMDFNNMDETNYKDIVDILSEIEQYFIDELESK